MHDLCVYSTFFKKSVSNQDEIVHVWSRIRKMLSLACIIKYKKLVSSLLIFSNIENCNALYSGVSSSLIKKLPKCTKVSCKKEDSVW